MTLTWISRGIAVAALAIAGVAGAVAPGSDGRCPPAADRASLARRSEDLARRALEFGDEVRDMVSQSVTRNPGSLDLGSLATQIQLDPVQQWEEIFRLQREDAYQLQLAEEAACSHYRSFGVAVLERGATRSERESCLTQLRSGEAPPDSYPGHEASLLRRVRSHDFRRRALVWTQYRGRMPRWAATLRGMATNITGGTYREDLEGHVREITEIVTAIDGRDWSRPPNKPSLQARFTQYRHDLLDFRFDLGEARSACQSLRSGSPNSPMMPIDTSSESLDAPSAQ